MRKFAVSQSFLSYLENCTETNSNHFPVDDQEFTYSPIKDFNALNLNPTASFNSIKATMINNTAPIYTVDNFKVKKLF